MRLLLKNIALLVATLRDIYTELKKIREILAKSTQQDMAVTARQAAIMLNVSQSTINNMYQRGQLKKYNIGGKRGFSANEIRAL